MPSHVFLALWEEWGVLRSWGDTHVRLFWVLSSERLPSPVVLGVRLERPLCPSGTAGPLIDGTSEDLKTCQLTSQLLSLALRLENVISDSSGPTLSSRVNDALC